MSVICKANIYTLARIITLYLTRRNDFLLSFLELCVLQSDNVVTTGEGVYWCLRARGLYIWWSCGLGSTVPESSRGAQFSGESDFEHIPRREGGYTSCLFGLKPLHSSVEEIFVLEEEQWLVSTVPFSVSKN